MEKTLEKFKKDLDINYFFIIFIIISAIFILTFPNYLYPDFNNLDRNFRNVLNAFFSGSTEVKSKTFGGKVEVHNLIIDQLFLTPQLKIIQLVNFFFDISVIQNLNYSSIYVKFYFFLINALLILFLIFIDSFLCIEKVNFQKDTIFLTSLLYPSSLMSITLPSSEAVYSVIIIFLFSRIFSKNLNSKQILFYLILGIYSIYLDSGNSLLSIGFILNIIILYPLINYNKIFFFIVFFITILLILSFANEIIYYVAYSTDSHKIQRIIGDIQNTSVQKREFYEICKRYFFFILTLLAILTSSKNLVFTSIIFVLYLIKSFLFYCYSKRKKIFNNVGNYELIILLNSIFFPYVVINMLPLHAYGKYYLFLIPIIFKMFSKFTNLNKLVKLNIVFSALFIFNIIIIKS